MQSRSSIKWKRTGALSSSKIREVRAPEARAIKQYHHVRQNSMVTKRSLLVSLCCVSCICGMTEEGSEVWDDDPVLKPSHALSAMCLSLQGASHRHGTRKVYLPTLVYS